MRWLNTGQAHNYTVTWVGEREGQGVGGRERRRESREVRVHARTHAEREREREGGTKDVFCREKHVFVATKLCRDKNDTCGSSRQ